MFLNSDGLHCIARGKPGLVGGLPRLAGDAAQQFSEACFKPLYRYDFPYFVASDRANRNIVPVPVTNTITRVTCAVVTKGTPSCSTSAVWHISAIPPGAVASTTLGTDSP